MLLVSPWVGEFGWEVYAWQSAMRHLSRNYNEVVVYCLNGHAALYEDFTDETIEIDAYDGNCCSYHRGSIDYSVDVCADVDVVRPSLFDYAGAEKSFIKFGHQVDTRIDVMFHVRTTGKLGTTWKNWDMNKWEELQHRFGSMKCACIGTKSDAGLLEDAEDLRGADLSMVMDHLASCKLMVGPSSGPIHLGCLCGASHVAWGQPRVQDRHEKLWNPFDAACFYVPSLNPDVDEVWNLCEKAIC